jgi:hypothetical protein
MLLLTSVNDLLQIALSTAGPVDVHTSWVDTVTATGSITPGRTNIAAISAGLTVVVSAPVAGAQRNVKTLHIRNKSAAPCQVIVMHSDGTNTEHLYDTTLGGGGALQCTDQGGFRLLG